VAGVVVVAEASAAVEATVAAAEAALGASAAVRPTVAAPVGTGSNASVACFVFFLMNRVLRRKAR
jgi:hypothetical protein